MGTGGEAMRTRFVAVVKRVDTGTASCQTSDEANQAMPYLLPSTPADRRRHLVDHSELEDQGLLSCSPQAYCYGGKDLIQTSCSRCHGLCMEAEVILWEDIVNSNLDKLT